MSSNESDGDDRLIMHGMYAYTSSSSTETVMHDELEPRGRALNALSPQRQMSSSFLTAPPPSTHHPGSPRPPSPSLAAKESQVASESVLPPLPAVLVQTPSVRDSQTLPVQSQSSDIGHDHSQSSMSSHSHDRSVSPRLSRAPSASVPPVVVTPAVVVISSPSMSLPKPVDAPQVMVTAVTSPASSPSMGSPVTTPALQQSPPLKKTYPFLTSSTAELSSPSVHKDMDDITLQRSRVLSSYRPEMAQALHGILNDKVEIDCSLNAPIRTSSDRASWVTCSWITAEIIEEALVDAVEGDLTKHVLAAYNDLVDMIELTEELSEDVRWNAADEDLISTFDHVSGSKIQNFSTAGASRILKLQPTPASSPFTPAIHRTMTHFQEIVDDVEGLVHVCFFLQQLSETVAVLNANPMSIHNLAHPTQPLHIPQLLSSLRNKKPQYATSTSEFRRERDSSLSYDDDDMHEPLAPSGVPLTYSPSLLAVTPR